MSEPAPRRLTVETFLSWQAVQEVRCELLDGRPVAMTGANFAHDQVVGNLRWSLKNQLRAASSPCGPFGADIGVTISPTTLRRPDVAVYCPPFDASAATSDRPRLIAEVLSRSTEQVDYFIKVEEYKTLPALEVILLVSPRTVEIVVWTRAAGAWVHQVTRDIGSVIALPDLGVSLPVRDVYDGVALMPPIGPRLVWPDEPPTRR